MKASYSNLMQSRFFSPAFNSAIFDGPVRIYFSQLHESLALKIYFSLQQKYPDMLAKAKELHKSFGMNLLVLIYPSTDSFQMSFEGSQEFVIEDQLGDDTLLGINGPFDDEQLIGVLNEVVRCLNHWETVVAARPEANLVRAEL
jgi:hypothetical protein